MQQETSPIAVGSDDSDFFFAFEGEMSHLEPPEASKVRNNLPRSVNFSTKIFRVAGCCWVFLWFGPCAWRSRKFQSCQPWLGVFPKLMSFFVGKPLLVTRQLKSYQNPSTLRLWKISSFSPIFLYNFLSMIRLLCPSDSDMRKPGVACFWRPSTCATASSLAKPPRVPQVTMLGWACKWDLQQKMHTKRRKVHEFHEFNQCLLQCTALPWVSHSVVCVILFVPGRPHT